MPEPQPGLPVMTAPPVIVGQPIEQPRIVVAKPITSVPSTTGRRIWTGDGPPPGNLVGMSVGDTYVDATTGTVYRLDPGE